MTVLHQTSLLQHRREGQVDVPLHLLLTGIDGN